MNEVEECGVGGVNTDVLVGDVMEV